MEWMKEQQAQEPLSETMCILQLYDTVSSKTEQQPDTRILSFQTWIPTMSLLGS